MTESRKVLILVPSSNARGGITNYFQILRKEYLSHIEYFERGARTWPVRNGFFAELVRAWNDYIVFKKRLKHKDILLVMSNTSLGLNSVIRDGLFLRYARIKGLKTIVLFHGWDDSIEKIFDRYYKSLIRIFFFKCDSIIVISNQVKKTLLKWGYKGEIIKETTLFDKNITININKNVLSNKYEIIKYKRELNFLFLSRMEKKKGIFELIEAFKAIKTELFNDFNIRLMLCGDGFELDTIKKITNELSIDGISIEGFVDGKKKQLAFEKSHIFVFPSHTEGMPLSVLEAMGFGLPVITTPVGGLRDFFKDGDHGYYIKINSPQDIKEKILKCINNLNELKKISLNNYTFANQRFRSDIVVQRIDAIFQEVLNK